MPPYEIIARIESATDEQRNELRAVAERLREEFGIDAIAEADGFDYRLAVPEEDAVQALDILNNNFWE